MSFKEYCVKREELMKQLKDKKITYSECHSRLKELYDGYSRNAKGKKAEMFSEQDKRRG